MQTTKQAIFRRWVCSALLLGSGVALSGCHIDMWEQPKMKPYFESDFFSDRAEVRPVVPGTVSQGVDLNARFDDAFFLGRDAAGHFVKTIPARAVRSFGTPRNMIERGQDRFDAYCSPCHGYVGDGDGMISQRGLGYWQKLPASYYSDRLRKVEDGYLYDVLVNGHGVMYGYGTRVQDINDRWAVVSYIRVLQFAHNADPSLAPANIVSSLHLTVPAPAASPSTAANQNVAPPLSEGAATAVVPGPAGEPALPPHVSTLSPAQFQAAGPKIEAPAASPASSTAASPAAASPAAASPAEASPSPSASVGAQ